MVSRSVVMESKLIVCKNCGYEFGADKAEVCRKCHEHICPKCLKCGCDTRDIKISPIVGRWKW